MSPITDEWPELTADEGYSIQDEFVRLLTSTGAQLQAVKLGLTSLAKQEQMNVKEPLYGWLTSAMRHAENEALATDRFIQPRAEPEIAFLIGHELRGPDVTIKTVLAATDAVMPALDILDSRFAGYRFTLPDVIADNASAAAFAVGSPVTIPGHDLDLLGCVFSLNGEIVGTAAGAATLGHPAGAVAWLVRKLARRGKSLAAGTIVLSGALTAAVPLGPGDRVEAEFDRIGSIGLDCE